MRWTRLLCFALLASGLGSAAGGGGQAAAAPLPGGPATLQQALVTIEPPPPELARIYFYRQPAPLLIALEPDVVVNGRSVGSIGMGDVFFRDARPGRYQVFLSADSEHVIELNLAAGEIGYVRATLRIGFGTTRISAERISAAVAVGEIDAMDNPEEEGEPSQTQR